MSSSKPAPGYFFGSKEALYRAVLDRVIADRRDLVTAIGERAVQANQPPAETIAELVSTHLDFLAGDRNFLALVDRENLAGGLGLDSLDAGFLEARKRHVLALIQATLDGRAQ